MSEGINFDTNDTIGQSYTTQDSNVGGAQVQDRSLLTDEVELFAHSPGFELLDVAPEFDIDSLLTLNRPKDAVQPPYRANIKFGRNIKQVFQAGFL
jgi:hypothetical protein